MAQQNEQHKQLCQFSAYQNPRSDCITTSQHAESQGSHVTLKSFDSWRQDDHLIGTSVSGASQWPQRRPTMSDDINSPRDLDSSCSVDLPLQLTASRSAAFGQLAICSSPHIPFIIIFILTFFY